MILRISICTLIVQVVIIFDAGLSEEITAIEGQVAVLPCKSMPTSQNSTSKATLLRWFRDSYHKPIYTLDVRHIDEETSTLSWLTNGARHFPSPDFEGRLYLELNSEIPTLRIDPVSFEDRGQYICQIEFRSSRSVSNALDVQIIVPPKGVVIRDPMGRKVEGVIGPFNLDEALIITCEALGGDPPPLLSWSGTYDNSSGAFKLNVTNTSSMITLPHLKRNDQWTHFTCTARNSNLTLPKSSTVTVEINLPPMDVKMQKNFQEPLSAGQQVTFTCQSFGSHPRAHIRWCLDGKIGASKDVITDNGNMTTSYHQRKLSSSDDGKSLDCIVTNPNIPSYILKQSYTMRVLYKPEILISIRGTTSNSIAEGSKVTIHCDIRSNPASSKPNWFFEGHKIFNSSSVHIKGGNLSIQEIRRRNAGNYTCEATNSEGSNSAAVHVDVEYAPVCEDVEISAKYRGEHNKDVANVTCNLSSNPTDVTFYWMTRNSSSNHSWSTGSDSYTLIKLEEGVVELFCWGKNTVGQQKTECSFSFEDPKVESSGIDSIFIISFVVIVLFIIVFVFCRKMYEVDRKVSKVESNPVIGLKDGGCRQMINNCVKSTSSSGETECLTDLLSSERSNDAIRTKNLRTAHKRTQEIEMRNERDEVKALLKWSKNERPRRIRSSQF